MEFLKRWVELVGTPTDPERVEAHRETVLTRTRTSALVAMVVIPFTIYVYFPLQNPLPAAVLATVTALCEISALLLLLGLSTSFLQRHYHLAFFVLVGIVCSGAEAVLLQLSGGAEHSNFLFPYFLILFGIATLFPARLIWAIAAAAMIPLSFVISEIAANGQLASGRPITDLLLLSNTALITVAANRVTTRTFFRELEHRQALEKANAQLRQLDKAKSDFFASLSHDLKTPLNLVIGPVQAVLRNPGGLEAGSQRYLEMALRGAKRLDSMINDMLDLARIEAGVGTIHPTWVDVRQLLSNLVETTVPYAASLGLTLTFEASADELLAEVDADKLDRIVGNLVSNALKFSKPGGKIQVVLSAPDAAVAIAVHDDGIGIAPEDHERIFRRFERAGRAGASAPGAGVGLSVVREFVELHQGKVAVTSALGKGSTFTVSLPRSLGQLGARTEAPVLAPRRPEAAPSAPMGTPRMLLVEDDDETRVFLAAELGRSAEVMAVATAETALRLADQRPDIILMDVSLPHMDGIEATRRLRSHPGTARAPILVYSARGDLATRLQAFEAGADDFVHKPVDPLELRARVESLLRRARGRTPGGDIPEPAGSPR